ncbi:MAG: hypothetical protein DHS20C14_11830 [Phycisphaeraceae bacterium]|nr:MAG: hypothetical protein DHS20C14_11830 [Phycisphaeraceae bacterium]
MKTTMIALAAAGLAVGTSSASATVYSWDWAQGDGGAGINNVAGTFKAISGSYDDVAETFTWDVTFDDQITDGYTLAVSPGPDPKGHAGELALIYFDASTLASPDVTVYSYNGENTQLSWADGSPAPGIQSPDKIASSLGINSADIVNASVSDAGGDRTFSLTLDTTNLSAHLPKHPGPGGASEWTGVEFGDALGVWLHPVKGLNTAYGVDGFLNGWNSKKQGWFDAGGFETVPAPASSLALAGMGLVACRRRRKA